MKPICTLAIIILFAACSSTEPTTLNSTADHKAKAERAGVATFAKNTTAADMLPAHAEVLGNWVMHTMQRQTQETEETLNINMELLPDNSFVVATGCGDVKGTYAIKGESEISFRNAIAKISNCSNSEQVQAMVRLLNSQVTHFAANGNMLFLRDKDGNNVFRVVR